MYTQRFRSHHDASASLKKQYTSPVSGEVYLPSVLSRAAQSRRVLYIHVPFCNKICSFCPFHRPDEISRKSYHEALRAQMDRICDYPYMNAPFDAVNFGGGTPTSLSPSQMAAVLSDLKDRFLLAPDAEISVETSASELSDEMLSVLREGGVNRLSVGVQTFDDEARRMLGRRGSGEFAASHVAAALRSGIPNTSVDLLYHYPGQTDEKLKNDLEILSALSVAGLSFYALILHEKTPLYRKITEEQLKEMADIEREKQLFDSICTKLTEKGYRMLELTKWVKDGRDRYHYMEVRHSGGSCVALGHGAGGNIEDYYYHNSFAVPDISKDLRICSRGRVLLPEYRVLDALIYEMQKGSVDLSAYADRLSTNLFALFERKLCELEAHGYLKISGETLTLTREGVFYGNNIISDLIRIFVARRFESGK